MWRGSSRGARWVILLMSRDGEVDFLMRNSVVMRRPFRGYVGKRSPVRGGGGAKVIDYCVSCVCAGINRRGDLWSADLSMGVALALWVSDWLDSRLRGND